MARPVKLASKKLRSLADARIPDDAEELDVGYNALTSLAGFPRLPKLHTLQAFNVSGNPLTHLAGIDHLNGLEELSFDGRRIKSIAKATDTHLRSISNLRLSVASRGVADYATYAAKKQIV